MRSSRLSPVRVLLPTAVLALVLVGCGGEESDTSADEAPQTASATPTPEPSASDQADNADQGEKDQQAAPAGQLVAWDDYDADRAAYADSDVVLYFHADWCHECQATDAALEADGVPDGLTLVEIDYDERTDLRQDYGVTVQHTFVLVDDAGEKQDAWTGTTSGAEIADRVA